MADLARTGQGARDPVSPAEVCKLCGAFENLLLCGRCGTSYYCSKEHQIYDWKNHKKQCRSKQNAVEQQDGDGGSSDSPASQPGKNVGQVTTDPGQSTVKPSVLKPPSFTVPSANTDSVTSPHTPRITELSETTEPGDHHAHTTTASRTPLGPLADSSNVHGPCTQIDQGGAKVKQHRDSSHARTSTEARKGSPSSLAITQPVTNRDGIKGEKPNAASHPQHLEATGVNLELYSEVDIQDKTSHTCTVSGQGPATTAGSLETFSRPVITSANMTITNSLKCGGYHPTARDPQDTQSTGGGCNSGARPKVFAPVPGMGQAASADSDSSQWSDTAASVSARTQLRGKRRLKDVQNTNLESAPPPKPEETKLADYVVKCMNNYGICVIDNFMGAERADSVLEDVKCLHETERLRDGQTVQQGTSKIRGDKITWVEKGDDKCDNIATLIGRLDSLMVACKGRLERYHINGRTKAMVACYPGDGTGYKRHIDNPKGDGRCVTCIFYLNKDWNLQTDGGLLRIYPAMFKQVADIEPKFDRLLFFWSDRRNPHEVQPAYKSRYAITVWYFDGEERKKAKLQHRLQDVSDSSGGQIFEVQNKPQ